MLRLVAIARTGFGAFRPTRARREPRADGPPDAAPGMVSGVACLTQAASEIAGNLDRICGE
jgi:hypothetical protein